MLADLAADAKPDELDTLEEEAQLLARTILERQQKPVPTSAMPDIISLAERFAKADEGMWGAARAMAFREEPTAEFIVPATEDTPKGTPVVGKFTVTNGEGNMLFEGENTIVTVGVDDVITLKASIAVDGGDAGQAQGVQAGADTAAGHARHLRGHRVRRRTDCQDDGEHCRERDDARRPGRLRPGRLLIARRVPDWDAAGVSIPA